MCTSTWGGGQQSKPAVAGCAWRVAVWLGCTGLLPGSTAALPRHQRKGGRLQPGPSPRHQAGLLVPLVCRLDIVNNLLLGRDLRQGNEQGEGTQSRGCSGGSHGEPEGCTQVWCIPQQAQRHRRGCAAQQPVGGAGCMRAKTPTHDAINHAVLKSVLRLHVQRPLHVLQQGEAMAGGQARQGVSSRAKRGGAAAAHPGGSSGGPPWGGAYAAAATACEPRSPAQAGRQQIRSEHSAAQHGSGDRSAAQRSTAAPVQRPSPCPASQASGRWCGTGCSAGSASGPAPARQQAEQRRQEMEPGAQGGRDPAAARRATRYACWRSARYVPPPDRLPLRHQHQHIMHSTARTSRHLIWISMACRWPVGGTRGWCSIAVACSSMKRLPCEATDATGGGKR